MVAMAVLTLPFALITGPISPASPNVSRQVMADAFIKEMEAFDGAMEKKYSEAEAAGNCLRFVGVVDVPGKKCSVELRQYPKTHPFAGTQYAATPTAHCILHTAHCSLLTAHYSLLPTAHYVLLTRYADNIVAFNTARYTPQPLVVQVRAWVGYKDSLGSGGGPRLLAGLGSGRALV